MDTKEKARYSVKKPTNRAYASPPIKTKRNKEISKKTTSESKVTEEAAKFDQSEVSNHVKNESIGNFSEMMGMNDSTPSKSNHKFSSESE